MDSKENIAARAHLLKTDDKVEILSAYGNISKDFVSSCSFELCSALSQLSELDNNKKLREDAIKNGKAIIKNWKPPTNDQIDQIFLKMLKAEKLA